MYRYMYILRDFWMLKSKDLSEAPKQMQLGLTFIPPPFKLHQVKNHSHIKSTSGL